MAAVNNAPGIGAVRPVGYDPDTGQVASQNVIPPLRMAEAVGDLTRRDWLVERDHDGQPGSPYTMVISTPTPTGAAACYLAGPTPFDQQAALLVQGAWPHDEHPADAWEVAAAWLWHGFSAEELGAWLAAGIQEPWHARALADLGFAPDQAPGVGWIARGEANILAELLAADRATRPERQAPAELHAAILDALRRVPRRLPAPTWADVTLEEDAAAELLARRLAHPRPAVAHAAAQELTTMLWRPLGLEGLAFAVPARWWQTPLGQTCARALGTTSWPPPTDPRELTVHEVTHTLDVDRGQVDLLRAAGELRRTAHGRLRVARPPV